MRLMYRAIDIDTFQSTPPHEGRRTWRAERIGHSEMFQSTPPHEGRHGEWR